MLTNFVSLPDEARVLILQLITAGVTVALLYLGQLLKLELGGYVNAIAAALAPVVVFAIEAALKTIPATFDALVLNVIHMIVLLLGSLGVFWVAKRKPAPSLK